MNAEKIGTRLAQWLELYNYCILPADEITIIIRLANYRLPEKTPNQSRSEHVECCQQSFSTQLAPLKTSIEALDGTVENTSNWLTGSFLVKVPNSAIEKLSNDSRIESMDLVRRPERVVIS